MNNITDDELKKIPYLGNMPNDGRLVLIRFFYDHKQNEWFAFHKKPNDEILIIKPSDLVIGSYISERPASINDFEFPLGTFICKYLSFPDLINPLVSLENDFRNFSSILEKYIIMSTTDSESHKTAQLIETELEYLIILSRSVYDLLQKISKHATSIVKSFDESHSRLIEDLPESFARITFSGNISRTSEQLISRYNLPSALAEFYVNEATLFQKIRDLRIAIEHHGKSPEDIIYKLEEGFAVEISQEPWGDLNIWGNESIKNNNLGSLRLIFLYVIHEILEMTNRYVQAYASCVQVQSCFSGDYKLYLRNHYSHHLVNLGKDLMQPWEQS